MSPDFDLATEIAAAVIDPESAMRFVARFAEASGPTQQPFDGYSEEELAEAERRLGIRLPAPLRDLYALIGRRSDLVRAQDDLLAPDALYIDTSGQALEFRVECQAVAFWGIPLTAIDDADPPVVCSYRSEPREWQPYLDRLSLAMIEMLLSEWIVAGGSLKPELAASRQLDDQAVQALEANFTRLPLPDYPMWTDLQGMPTRWYFGMGAVLCAQGDTWLWVAANSPEALAAVRDALPGHWKSADPAA